MRRLKVLIFLFLLFPYLCDAQIFMKITGKVTDAQNNSPLPFANVTISGTYIGTITNDNGFFLLKIPHLLKTDTLAVSFLGYHKAFIPLSNYSTTDTLSICLQPLTLNISEVLVQRLPATELITKALSKIPQNYSTQPVGMQAFYREIISDNGYAIQFIEAVLGIYKGSYLEKRDKDRMKIIKGREKTDVYSSTLWNYLYFINGPYEMLQTDIAKYPKRFITVPQSYTSFLNERHYKFYTYKLWETYLEGRPVYIIHFEPNSRRRAVYEGKIFIDKRSLAFIGMEYWIAPSRLSSTSVLRYDTRRALEEDEIETQTIDFYSYVRFRELDGCWYLSNAKMQYQFLFIDHNFNSISNIQNDITFVVTDIDTVNVEPIQRRNFIQYNRELSEQLGEFDEEFWENYNFVKFEGDLN